MMAQLSPIELAARDGQLEQHFKDTVALALRLNAEGKTHVATTIFESLAAEMRAAGFYAFMIEAPDEGQPGSASAGACLDELVGAIRSHIDEARLP